MDIRELYQSLSPEDRMLYQKIRTDIRKVYLHAHTNIVGMDHWTVDDDYFLDLLDMKVAVLFDRAGAIEGAKAPVSKDEVKAIENSVEKQGKAVTVKMSTEMSEASKTLKNGKADASW